MKRNISIIIGIAIVLVIIVLLGNKKNTEITTNTQVQQPTVQVVNNNKPVTTYTTKKVPATTDYATYINNLGIATNKCNVTAKDQYSKQYSNLEGSSFQSWYNETTGACYSKVIGKIKAAYATTTTSYIIFRNVYNNNVLMQCTDSIGMTYGDNEWTCKDNVSGKTVAVPEFNALISKYVTK